MMIDPIILSILIRLIVPLLTLQFPFFGFVAAIIADALGDCMLVDILGGGFGDSYHLFDKWLDFYMITIAVIVSLRFKKLEKYTCLVLFSIRAVGIILFEITNSHLFLIIFPNIFEFFFVFITFTKIFWKKFELTKKNLVMVLLIISVPKIILEIIFHSLGLDQFFWNLWLQTKGLFIS
jgi:hypothetical protein